MRRIVVPVLFGLILSTWTAGGRMATTSSSGENMETAQNSFRIVLLGASVGRHWDFPGLSRRMDAGRFVFEYKHGGGFDKTDRLMEVLQRSKNRPDAVILKECAAYFPKDPAEYRAKMREWVKTCRKEGVIPVPATVVPVTRLNAFKQVLIDILKGRRPLRFGNPFAQRRNRAILAYNDWIRSFCRDENLICLDMEAPTVYGAGNRFLREDFARLDGLHINRKAYRRLDEIIRPLLRRLERAGGN